MSTKLSQAKTMAEDYRSRAAFMRAAATRIRLGHTPALDPGREAEALERESWAEEDDLTAEIFDDAVRGYEAKEEETI